MAENIRLSKTELAALDLLIAQMEEAQAAGGGGQLATQYTPVLARVAWAYTATRYWVTPRITVTRWIAIDYPPIEQLGPDAARMAALGPALGAGLSLNELLEIRRQASGEDGGSAG